MRTKQFLLLLLIIITSQCFSQRIKGTVMSFKYKGQSFQIYTGAKIGFGKGLGTDGGFECASREKVIRKRETYGSTGSSYTSNRETNVSTGEREYLPKQFSNTLIAVLKVVYVKKLDEYRITLSTAEGNYNFYLLHGLKNGEIVSVNGVKLPEVEPAATFNTTSQLNNAATAYETGAVYSVKLKNGSSVNGILREANNGSFKIETSDKNVFVFTSNEILEITRVGENNATPGALTGASDFEIVQSPYGPGRDTTPAGCFANYTDFDFLLANKLEHTYSGNYGFRLSNSLGYLYRNFFFIGLGIDYSNSLSSAVKYHAVSFGLNQRFFMMPKKKISPFVSLNEKAGTLIKNVSTASSSVISFGGDVGVDFKVGKKLSLTPHVGYTFHLLRRVPTRSYTDAEGVHIINGTRTAHYFTFGLSVGFMNK